MAFPTIIERVYSASPREHRDVVKNAQIDLEREIRMNIDVIDPENFVVGWFQLVTKEGEENKPIEEQKNEWLPCKQGKKEPNRVCPDVIPTRLDATAIKWTLAFIMYEEGDAE